MCDSQTYIYGTKEYIAFSKHYSELIEFLCEKAGLTKYEPFNAFKVASTLTILVCSVNIYSYNIAY